MDKSKVVSISARNSKMGEIPSVSLPPRKTCPNCKFCTVDGRTPCYAEKLCRIYPTVKAAYERNLSILTTDRKSYFDQVKAAASLSKYFRFHVSGDIIDADYLHNMCKIARALKDTHFLCFSKSYEIINAYFNNHVKPRNLHLILSLPFSGVKIQNPHNLPTAAVILKGQEPDEGWKICGGNCSECACRGVGCWQLKKGETIAFYEH